MVERTIDNRCAVVTLSPNRSANWAQTKILITIIGVFVLCIALAWTAMGVWVILPFAGLEVSLLAFLMYRGSYSTYRKQVITISQDTLKFEAGVYRPSSNYQFSLQDLSLNVIEPNLPFDFSKLCFKDPQHSLEFGQFLNQEDRQLVIDYLQQAGVYIQRDKWWLQNK
jgi:uncharacterized membrane protein